MNNTAYKTDQFYRFVWEKEDYTVAIEHFHADTYFHYLASKYHSNSHKAKCMKALKRLFKWKHYEQGGDLWEPEITFSDSNDNQPQDYLTIHERKAIQEAALEYGSIPAYNTVTPEERSQWKTYLSQRFGKPNADVSIADWKRANGWKIPSLVWVSLDAGLHPVEVEQAVIEWVDLENGVLRIPKEEPSKNRDNWVIGLRDQTVNALGRWLKERHQYSIYKGTNSI